MKSTIAFLVGLTSMASIGAEDRYDAVSAKVNQRMVKVFGSGGYLGVVAYGSGVVVSPDGYVLTAAGSLLDTTDLRVHLYDGRRCSAKVIAIEPALDAALIKIEGVVELPFFDLVQAATRPLAIPGDWILGFSNAFEIATRDEPMSVQRGVIASYTRLSLQRGIFDAPYVGEVYVLDAITNNPGAAGGALVSRSGELLGMIGKELRNSLADTWVNYALPVQARIEVKEGDASRTISLTDLISLGMKGSYQPTAAQDRAKGEGAYHGILLVPNVVERTPPYVDEVVPGSPAATSGLKPDDLIVYIDGVPIHSISTFRTVMATTRPGQTVKLEIRRGEKLEPIEVKLEAKPEKR